MSIFNINSVGKRAFRKTVWPQPGLAGVLPPPDDEISQGFHAVFQYSSQALASIARRSLAQAGVDGDSRFFQLTDTVDDIVAAAIVAKNIIFDTASTTDSLTDERTRIEGVPAISEGLGVICNFETLRLSTLGRSPTVVLSWRLEAVVQAVQVLQASQSTVLMVDFDNGILLTEADQGTPQLVNQLQFHRFITTLATAKLEVEVDVNLNVESSNYASYVAVQTPDNTSSFLRKAIEDHLPSHLLSNSLTPPIAQRALELWKGEGNKTVWKALSETTELELKIEEIASGLTGLQLALTPNSKLSGNVSVDLSSLGEYSARMVATPGNLDDVPVISLAVELGDSNANVDIDNVGPFCGSANFAYFLSVPVLQVLLPAVWGSPGAPAKTATAEGPISIEYSDGSTGEGTVTLRSTAEHLNAPVVAVKCLETILDMKIEYLNLTDDQGQVLSSLPRPKKESLMWKMFPFDSYDDLGYQSSPDIGQQLHDWIVRPLVRPFGDYTTELANLTGRTVTSVQAIVLRGDVRS